MLILENNHPPMRKLTQPWKLRRSFGSQPVGNVAGPRWTEAGIATQVISALPSRRTYRGKVDHSSCSLPFLVVDDPRVPTRAICHGTSSGAFSTFNTNSENIGISCASKNSMRQAKRSQAPANVGTSPPVLPLSVIFQQLPRFQ